MSPTPFWTAWSDSRMDAREQLRRYLEQRRDAGETELVLDQLTVEEVMRLVGAGSARTAGSGGQGNAAAESTPRRPTVTPESTPPADHASADWREVLRNTGAAPDKTAARQPPE